MTATGKHVSERFRYHGGVEDVELLPGGDMDRPWPSLPVQELVDDPHVGKGSPHDDLVVAPTAAIGAEVLGLDAALAQVFRCRCAVRDLPRVGDVVSGDAVAKVEQAVGFLDGCRARWRHGHALKVGGLADVGGAGVPWVERRLWHRQLVPLRVTLHD